MRTVIYPLNREDERANRELLDYLFDTVLYPTGTMQIENPYGNRIEVFAIMNPHSHRCTYCATLRNKPDEAWGAPAKYIGITSTDGREVRDFILCYQTKEQKEKRLGKKTPVVIRDHAGSHIEYVTEDEL